MKIKNNPFFCILASLLVFMACTSTSSAKKGGVIVVPAGSNIPSLGMALDASYDSSTDGVVPGYKILSVAVANNSLNIIQMDSSTDEWMAVDARGRRHKAITDLRNADVELFLSLPEKLRSAIEYPMLIQVGESRVIDLLFKNSVNLDGFRNVKFTSRLMQKTFEIVP